MIKLSPFVQFDLTWREILSGLNPALSPDTNSRMGWTLYQNGTSALYRVFRYIRTLDKRKTRVGNHSVNPSLLRPPQILLDTGFSVG